MSTNNPPAEEVFSIDDETRRQVAGLNKAFPKLSEGEILFAYLTISGLDEREARAVARGEYGGPIRRLNNPNYAPLVDHLITVEVNTSLKIQVFQQAKRIAKNFSKFPQSEKIIRLLYPENLVKNVSQNGTNGDKTIGQMTIEELDQRLRELQGAAAQEAQPVAIGLGSVADSVTNTGETAQDLADLL